MLTFNLKKQWYDKIASGEKRIEYREVKPYWTKRFNKVFAIKQNDGSVLYPFPRFTAVCESIKPPQCILRLGYTRNYMTANITKIKVVDGKETDLKIDKPVYAIYLAEVKEVKE